MDLASFETQIRLKALSKRVFVFSGKENFLKERAIEKIIKAYIAPEDVHENVRRVDFDTARADDFLRNLAIFSFNDSKRISLLFNPESLEGPERKILCGKLLESGIPSDVTVIFLLQETSVANELSRLLGENCERIDFWPPFENQLTGWIQNEADDLECQILLDAADLLLERTGPDLRILFQELTKLALQAGKGGKITFAMVDHGVGYLKQESVFDLVEHIGTRNLPKAVRSIENLLQMGETTQKNWGVMVKALRDYKLLHDLNNDRPDLFDPVMKNLKGILILHGKSDYKANQEKKRLGSLIQEQAKKFPEFFTDNLRLDNPMQIKSMALALKYSKSELDAVWPKLLETDFALKNSPPNLNLVFQKLLIDLISRRKTN